MLVLSWISLSIASNASGPPRAGILNAGTFLPGAAVGIRTRACPEVEDFHSKAPRISPATRTTVTVQLMTLKRLSLKNDENLHIRIMAFRLAGLSLTTHLLQDFGGIPGYYEHGRDE